MSIFRNKDGKSVVLNIVKEVQDNKAYLGEVDGLIGDGDHGMNMNKGFTIFEKRFADKDFTFSKGLYELGNILFSEIGGSMGPIYGTIFMDAGEAGEEFDEISSKELGIMLQAGMDGLCEVVEARVGDKTLMDTLTPAVEALQKEEDFLTALQMMKTAAAKGRDSTKDMAARFGRSSRLGERSKGVLDAGAVSCCIILTAMADGIIERLQKGMSR